jgi:hypothetical protein
VTDAEAKARREILLKVYEASIAEYRFNVQLNWDRSKFYIGLSVTAMAAGTALLKLATDTVLISILLPIYFLCIFFITLFGSSTINKGKEYTRRANLTKTLVERELGLFKQIEPFGDPELHLGITVTPGQRKYISAILQHKKRELKITDLGSNMKQAQWIFKALMAAEIILCIISAGGIFTSLQALQVVGKKPAISSH